jgi:hypothetical protein
MFIVWQSTTTVAESAEPFTLGVRVLTGPSAGDYRVAVAPEGMKYEAGAIDDLKCVLEFDPSSFVLTAFGRSNAGTVRGDRRVAERFLNQFFRI